MLISCGIPSFMSYFVKVFLISLSAKIKTQFYIFYVYIWTVVCNKGITFYYCISSAQVESMKTLLVNGVEKMTTTSPRNILIQSVAGGGKSTLCNRLAYLWANNSAEIQRLDNFDLVFLIIMINQSLSTYKENYYLMLLTFVTSLKISECCSLLMGMMS